MAKRGHDLPIILSHNTHTGVMIFPNRKMDGRDVLIVGLNRDVPSGEGFELKDISWIKAVLHFGDVDSLRITIDVMQKELKRWEGERDDRS